MLFNFSSDNQDAIGIEISSDNILIVETLERGDYFMSVNYLDIDLSHYHHKYRSDNILSEDIIRLIVKSLKENNFYSKNLNISYYSNFNKRFILELPLLSKDILDIVLPLEIQKYLRNKHIKFLEEIDFKYYLIENLSKQDKNCKVIVDIFSRRENLLFSQILQEDNKKYNYKIFRSFENIISHLEVDKTNLLFNFRKNSIEFAIMHKNNIIYFNSISKGIDMIRYNLKQMFDLSDVDIDILYHNFYQFYKLCQDDSSNKSVSLTINGNNVVMKKIYIENIINTVYNLLSEIQSMCNNIIINNNFFQIDKICIFGEIDKISNILIKDLEKLYKKEVVIFDGANNIRTNILEENNYFKDNKNKFSISLINSIN